MDKILGARSLITRTTDLLRTLNKLFLHKLLFPLLSFSCPVCFDQKPHGEEAVSVFAQHLALSGFDSTWHLAGTAIIQVIITVWMMLNLRAPIWNILIRDPLDRSNPEKRYTGQALTHHQVIACGHAISCWTMMLLAHCN